MSRFIKILCALCACLVLYFGGGKIARIVYPIQHEEIVTRYAEEYGIDKELVYAVIKAESNFDENAVSGKRAAGLMQIMTPTAEWIAEKLGNPELLDAELSDPETNIRMGTYYISYLLDMYGGNKKCALSAYNAGHANVDSWLLSEKYSKDGETLAWIPFPETEKYVNQVLKNEKIYHYLYGEE